MLFAYRLALSVGRADVSRMLSEMSIKDWHGWLAYYEREPFGAERNDLMIAQLCAITANANRPRNSRPFKPADFLPDFTPKEPQDWKAMRQTMRLYIEAHNGNGTS